MKFNNNSNPNILIVSPHEFNHNLYSNLVGHLPRIIDCNSEYLELLSAYLKRSPEYRYYYNLISYLRLLHDACEELLGWQEQVSSTTDFTNSIHEVKQAIRKAVAMPYEILSENFDCSGQLDIELMYIFDKWKRELANLVVNLPAAEPQIESIEESNTEHTRKMLHQFDDKAHIKEIRNDNFEANTL